MLIFLVVDPEGSGRPPCLAVAETLDHFRHALKPGATVYTLGWVDPRTPPGVLAHAAEISILVAHNCKKEVIGHPADPEGRPDAERL